MKNTQYEQQYSRRKAQLDSHALGKSVRKQKKLDITNWNEQTYSKCTPILYPAPVQCLKSD